MPTYEYQCLDCGEKVEYIQSFHEPPATVCPACEGKLTRLVSGGTGLIFKGSGFYITDYKKSNSSGSNGSNEKSDKNGKHEKSEAAEKGEKPTKLRSAENASSTSETKPASTSTVTEQK